MPDRVTTSFIPKESLASERAPRPTRGNPFVLVNIIAGFILIASLAASGGLFLFQKYTESSIQSKRDSLERQRAAFEPASIRVLSRLDKRLTTAEKLLKNHTALSMLFADLETRAGSNIRFNDFTYEPAGSGRMVVSMSGSAKSFNAVALQADQFGKSTIFKDPIFSNLNIDPSGNVVFAFTAVVDTTHLSYASLVASGALTAPAAATPTETTPAATSTPKKQ